MCQDYSATLKLSLEAKRVDLVEGQFGNLEWESSGVRGTRLNNRNRCFPERVGNLLHGANHRGKVVSPGTTLPYKLSRTVGRGICSQSFYKEQGSSAGSTVDGQHISSALHQQNGRTRSLILASLAKNLWEWCLERQIVLEAQHIPDVSNIVADWESRVFVDNNDWKLAPQVFDNLNQVWGPEVDLFATRLSKQLPRFVSWRPDPEAESVNAWAQDWSNFRGYAFPPFSLVGRWLKQVLTQSVPTLVLIAPVWRTQPWYRLLLELSIAPPRLLPPIPGLLTKMQEVHPLTNFQLAG